MKVTQEFLADWDQAPSHVKEKLDRRVKQWSMTGELSPSAQAHRAFLFDTDLWICYVGMGRGGFRALVRFVEGYLVLERLVDHEQMERLLRPAS